MPSESGERRTGKPCDHLGTQPPVTESLPCPRCESNNTKFCYYNNYNMSQPRYFCKSCRRYWTHGGTLRNIPVGGTNRKNSKRSRTSSASSSSCSSVTQDPAPAVPVSFVKPEVGSLSKHGVNLNENVSGSCSAFLNSRGPGFLALGGYGMGVGPGFDEIGYGLSRGVGIWSFPHDVGGGCGNGGGGAGYVGGDALVASSGRNTFPVGGNVDAGWPDADCLGWPDLAMSMAGNGLK